MVGRAAISANILDDMESLRFYRTIGQFEKERQVLTEGDALTNLKGWRLRMPVLLLVKCYYW